MTTETMSRSPAIEAIYAEMARQMRDSLASLEGARAMAPRIAESLRRTKALSLLGMGGSHAVGRTLEPLYRALGVDSVATPLSEQLGQPRPLAGKTVIVTSQSGESAEVLRWFAEGHANGDTYGLTMEQDSSLARLAPCLVGSGGSEIPFAATRSLTVTIALHAAVLEQLGADLGPLRRALAAPAPEPDLAPAIRALAHVGAIVTSGRQLQGVAEAIALGLTELSRLPCFSLEGGELRHGPLEMLSEKVGVVLFRADDATAHLVTGLGEVVARTPSPLIVFDASGRAPIEGAVTIPCGKAEGLEAIFRLLPAAQRLMVDFAASRVSDAGHPLRSTKVTRVE